jgi:DNA-binding MarR family transcriptional regulator
VNTTRRGPKPGIAPPSRPDLGILLAMAYQEFVDELRIDLARRGFDAQGRTDGYVLRALAARPMTVSALAVQLGMTKQGAGQVIDDMERRGYVARSPDPDDARARVVALSPHGTAALSAARAFHRRCERRLARRHGAAALTALREVLTSLAGDGEPDARLRAHSL